MGDFTTNIREDGGALAPLHEVDPKLPFQYADLH
jgi:hypothetical protein